MLIRSSTVSNTHGRDPVHPVNRGIHEYEITRLDYHHNPEDRREDYLDLVLRRGDSVRRLRFLGPTCLRIEDDFPSPTHGMVILDIRQRQWEGVGVEVDDFENCPGSVTFCARDVLDLDAAPDAGQEA